MVIGHIASVTSMVIRHIASVTRMVIRQIASVNTIHVSAAPSSSRLIGGAGQGPPISLHQPAVAWRGPQSACASLQ